MRGNRGRRRGSRPGRTGKKSCSRGEMSKRGRGSDLSWSSRRRGAEERQRTRYRPRMEESRSAADPHLLRLLRGDQDEDPRSTTTREAQHRLPARARGEVQATTHALHLHHHLEGETLVEAGATLPLTQSTAAPRALVAPLLVAQSAGDDRLATDPSREVVRPPLSNVEQQGTVAVCPHFLLRPLREEEERLSREAGVKVAVAAQVTAGAGAGAGHPTRALDLLSHHQEEK